MLKKIFQHIDEIVGSMLVFIFVSLVALNVIARYLFQSPISWIEEVVLIAFIWSVYIGTITGFREERHIAIDVIFNLLPVKIRKTIDYVTSIIIIILNGYMTWSAITLIQNLGKKQTFILKLPYAVLDLALVVCFGAMTIIGIYKLYLKLTNNYTPPADSLTQIITEEYN